MVTGQLACELVGVEVVSERAMEDLQRIGFVVDAISEKGMLAFAKKKELN